LQDLLRSLALDLIDTLDPTAYFRRIGYEPYEWQIHVLDAIKQGHKSILIVGARQAGKSTLTAGIPAYISKSQKALSLIYAPSDEQSKDDLERVKEFIRADETYPKLVLESADHIKLPGGALIKANTSTAKTKRGKSMPRVILFDEAAMIEDELFGTVSPMLVKNPECIRIAISSPFGKTGWFYRASMDKEWFRVVVRAPWDVENDRIVPAEPENIFKARMLKQGIHGFYSPRHDDRDFMERELFEHGEYWFRQEYLCEFVDAGTQVFSTGLIASLLQNGIGGAGYGIGIPEEIPLERGRMVI
jgi:hypothetical protein